MALGRETWRLALKLIVRQPGRSALTMLGLAIGVGAFIAMVSFGEGARRSVVAQFEVLGTNLIKVQTAYPAVNPKAKPSIPIGDSEVRHIRREATTVAHVLAIARRSASVSWGGEQRPSYVNGVDPVYLGIHSWDVAAGGNFDAADMAESAKVCLLGKTNAKELFGDRDPLGQTVTLAGLMPCRVIGVLAEKGYSTNAADIDDIVLVPVTTYNTYLTDRPTYAYLEVEPLDKNLLDTARSEITDILRRAHGIEPGDPDDFSVSSPLEVIRAADRTARILGTLLAAIAAVSLLVGGIGIMNIQLVSVAERTEEIGVRAAIGASPNQILTQFLIEALILTMLGTLVGVTLGIGVASFVAQSMGWPRVISPSGVLFSAGFGIAVGVLFGYLPARRAALLDPIHALRRQ
ncbi:MAG TPA: ABC transporter permease [Polyangiaceae bacterium]|nr:ABC transporter permease [Polyangiaceae bacterium]